MQRKIIDIFLFVILLASIFNFNVFAKDAPSTNYNSTCYNELQLEEERKSWYTEENIDNFSLNTRSFLTVEELEAGLQKELKNYVEIFIEAEKEYNINAIFLASVAAVESGWGETPNENNNLFGWSSNIYYENPEDSILPIAEKLKEYYLSSDGIYYNGDTVDGVNVKYNGREEWSSLIKSMMIQIADDIY